MPNLNRLTPILILTPAWLVGIFLQGWLGLDSFWLWIGLAGGFFLAGLAILNNRRTIQEPLPSVLPLCLVFLCAGALRLIWAAPSTNPDSLLAYYDQEDVRVIGLVSAEPTYGTKTNSFRFEAQQILLPNSSTPILVSGEIYVRLIANNVDVTRGNLLQLTGKLSQPKEISGDDFPYKDWLKRQGIYTTLEFPYARLLAIEQDFIVTRWLYRLSASTKELITKFIPGGNEGQLLVGILLGDKTRIELRTRTAFTHAGIAHILAVSGSNLSILAMLITLVLQRFFRRQTVGYTTIGILTFYVLLVGPSPSVMRAWLMATLAIGGILLGREYIGLNGLVGSALIMTLHQPTVLMDIGFQLSFMATLGLIIIAQPLQKRTLHWPPVLQEGIIITLAAEIMVIPLVAFYFHNVSLVALLTNLLILPTITIVMVLGSITVVAGIIFGNWFALIPEAFGGLTYIFLSYIINITEFCANLPYAFVDAPYFHPIWIFLYYGLVGVAIWWLRGGQQSKIAARLTSRNFLIAISLATLLVWAGVWFTY